jgi:sulfite exporter TauE/SafE
MMPLALFPAAMIGLLGSAHCVVMCGGVVAMTCSALPLNRRGRVLAQLPYVLAYNAGRVTSYALAGAAAGALGASVAHLAAIERTQLLLRLAAGAAMFAVGLYVAGATAALRWVERAAQPMWRRVARVASALVPVRSPSQALALGLLWGFMPCGLVYAALALALASGSAWAGGTTMVAFGLGTLPMLVTLGSAGALVVRAARAPAVRRSAGVAMILFGIVQAVSVERAWATAGGAGEPTRCILHHHG